MDPNPKFYYLSGDSAKKWTLIIDSVQFFDFYSSMVIFSHFGPLGGLWGGRLSLGAPQGPYEKLNLLSYPQPVSGVIASSLGQTRGFLGCANLVYFNSKVATTTTTTTDGEGGGGGSAICFQQPQIFSTSSLKVNFTYPQ